MFLSGFHGLFRFWYIFGKFADFRIIFVRIFTPISTATAPHFSPVRGWVRVWGGGSPPSKNFCQFRFFSSVFQPLNKIWHELSSHRSTKTAPSMDQFVRQCETGWSREAPALIATSRTYWRKNLSTPEIFAEIWRNFGGMTVGGWHPLETPPALQKRRAAAVDTSEIGSKISAKIFAKIWRKIPKSCK